MISNWCGSARGKPRASAQRFDVTRTPDGIRVEIYDQEYFMRGGPDPEYIRTLASYLDAKMRAIAERTHTVDSLRVAILAALNIVDEYHQLKAKHEATTQEVDQKVSACSAVLDRLLE